MDIWTDLAESALEYDIVRKDPREAIREAIRDLMWEDDMLDLIQNYLSISDLFEEKLEDFEEELIDDVLEELEPMLEEEEEEEED